MTVYFIACIQEIRDWEGMVEYSRVGVKALSPKAGRIVAAMQSRPEVEAIKGRVGASINSIDTIEGKPLAGIAVLSFPDRKSFDDWYNSDAYQEALKLRLACSDTQALVVEGA